MLFAAGTPFSFGFNFDEDGYFIAVLIDHVGSREETLRAPLKIFIELLEARIRGCKNVARLTFSAV
jgi:hypothetical protein